jgi:hypothetical protein
MQVQGSGEAGQVLCSPFTRQHRRMARLKCLQFFLYQWQMTTFGQFSLHFKEPFYQKYRKYKIPFHNLLCFCSGTGQTVFQPIFTSSKAI